MNPALKLLIDEIRIRSTAQENAINLIVRLLVAKIGFCPNGGLVAGDVMLVQKIARETNEQTTLAVANQFKVQAGRRSHPNSSQTRLL
jgi:hypothetical protein